MDFRELAYITAVADEHSVTEAAKRLYISQPSLSYIISKAERALIDTMKKVFGGQQE